jgi:hypothetical protein
MHDNILHNYKKMNSQEAKKIGKDIAAYVWSGEVNQAYDILAMALAQRTPFPKLGLIGVAVGQGPFEPVNAFLAHIADQGTEGGWVVIGTALGQQLNRDLEGAFASCRDFIVAADIWYGADILGERVPGPALVTHFQPALSHLEAWRADENHWVRRAVGVAVHYWTKRSEGKKERKPQAEKLLKFLEPMFEEWNMPAAKGVGWGLKTLGKYYPEPLTAWLGDQLPRRHRAVIENKALTYLSQEQRERAKQRMGEG